MQTQVNKDLIKTKFKKGFKTYNQNASVQGNMAIKLMEIIREMCGVKFDRILEIGCGTGILTNLITKNMVFKELELNDIVEESKNFIDLQPQNICFLDGDAEEILFNGKYDLIISNATFQWFTSLSVFIKKIRCHLNDHGVIAFTTFGPANLYEILTITDAGLDYLPKEKLEELFKDHFNIIYSHSELKHLTFSSPIKVLRHLKEAGLNSLNNKQWLKKDLTEFELKYKQLFSVTKGVQLTYEPYYFVLSKLQNLYMD